MFLVAFGIQEMAFGRIQVAKQWQANFFVSIIFCSLGFIREYSENLYTTKISTYTVYTPMFV